MTTIPAVDLESLITRVKAAQKQFANFTQEQVDLIFRKAANLTVPRKNSALSQCAMTKTVRTNAQR